MRAAVAFVIALGALGVLRSPPAPAGEPQHLGTFLGTQHKNDSYVRKGNERKFKTSDPMRVTVTRLPGNLLQVARGRSWKQTFRILSETSPSAGVREIAYARPVSGDIARDNEKNLGPGRWYLRWMGGWSGMSGKGMVTLYEDGRALTWENQGKGTLRIGFMKFAGTWDETFLGER